MNNLDKIETSQLQDSASKRTNWVVDIQDSIVRVVPSPSVPSKPTLVRKTGTVRAGAYFSSFDVLDIVALTRYEHGHQSALFWGT